MLWLFEITLETITGEHSQRTVPVEFNDFGMDCASVWHYVTGKGLEICAKDEILVKVELIGN